MQSNNPQTWKVLYTFQDRKGLRHSVPLISAYLEYRTVFLIWPSTKFFFLFFAYKNN